jgi:hypothetical protein
LELKTASFRIEFGANSTGENTAQIIEKKYVGIGVNESKTNEISTQANQTVIYATVSVIVIIIIFRISASQLLSLKLVIRSFNKRKSENIASQNLQNLNTEL